MLEEIEEKAKNPTECFSLQGEKMNFAIVDFWKWSLSNLIENRNRGVLAEFIVKQALEVHSETRLEWDAYDLMSDGIKIEVKSAAYIQSWHQKKLSRINFSIAPTSTVLKDNNFSKEKKRQADIYIFCLLETKDQKIINPLDLDQWVFFIVSTQVFNEQIPFQKSIGLHSLEKLKQSKCSYSQLKEEFGKIKNTLMEES